MENITLLFNRAYPIAIPAIPLIRPENTLNNVIPGLEPESSPGLSEGMFRTPPDARFRRHDVYTVCSPSR
jgi:hypothetical protein